MNLVVTGIILGIVMVMPGMSGGTAFLILGLYEDLVKDIIKFRFKPYIPLAVGVVAGIFISGFAFTYIFENYKNATVSFLLGCLLASIKSIVKDCPPINMKYLLVVIGGAMVGAVTVGDSLSLAGENSDVSIMVIIIGGALASAAMIIPGIPGSSVMILLGIYDVMFVAIRELDMVILLSFGLGAIIGVVGLLKLIAELYATHKFILSYLFAGLVLGSCRSMIPSDINLINILIFIGGFSMVWYFSSKDDLNLIDGQVG